MLDEHRKSLRSGLVDLLFEAQYVQVVALVGEALAERFPAQSVPGQKAEWVIDRALESPTHELFVKVVRRTDDHLGGALPRALIDLVAALEAGQRVWHVGLAVAAADPIVVDDGGPFLNREAFRRLLPTPGSDTPLVTLVQGDRGAGKSYLASYCKVLAARRNDFRLAWAQIPEGSVRDLDAEVPALQLAVALGTPMSRLPRRHENPDRYAENLVNWLLLDTPPRDGLALMLLDGFDHPDLPLALRTFVSKLLSALHDPETGARESYRLMLLGYRRSWLEDEGYPIQSHVLGHIGGEHIESWFRTRFPDQLPAKYSHVRRLVESNLPESGPARLTLINHRIRALAEQFAA